MIKITQGHKSNVIGRVESLDSAKKLIRKMTETRWAGPIKVTIGHSGKTAVAKSGDIAIHYQLEEVNG